ncbi:MAG: glycosyltransferase family 4 protein, partial [Hyphomicrobiales bacterium]|nr:glycosyltransferase family 4 protein [Hyphomicrobiales bacterium]
MTQPPPPAGGQPARTVLIDASAAFQQLGGIARYQRGLVAGLRRWRPDWQIALAADCVAHPKLPPELAGLPVHWQPGGNKLRRLRDLLSHRPPVRPSLDPAGCDLFHATDFSAPRLPGLPVVVTIHDLTAITHPQFHQPLHRLHLRLAIPPACRQAAKILCDSAATREDLVQLFPETADRATVVYPGVEPRFAPQAAATIVAVRARYDLPGQYLLSVGTIEPRKGHRALIELQRSLRALQPGSPPLYIAGPLGWKAAPFLAALERSPVRGLVRLLGPVDDDDLPALYSGALAFLFPSLYEGFGLPALEAMACGTPVIASRTAG